MQTEAQKGYEYSTSSATYAVKPGGTDRIKADFRHLREHLWRFSLPIELFLPSALVGERIAHALDGGEAKNTDGGRPLA